MKRRTKIAVSVAVLVAVGLVGYPLLSTVVPLPNIIPMPGGGEKTPQQECFYCKNTGKLYGVNMYGETTELDCPHPAPSGFKCIFCQDTMHTAEKYYLGVRLVDGCPDHGKDPGRYTCDYCHDCGYVAIRVMYTDYDGTAKAKYPTVACPWCLR